MTPGAIRRTATLPLLLLVAGCAAAQCNPGSAGFLTGIGCAVGGGYQERTQSLSTQATQSRLDAGYAMGQAQRARQAEAEADYELAHERQQLARMEQEQRALGRRLAAARAGNGLTAAQLAKARRQLAALRQATRAEAAAPTPDPAAIARLKARQQHLLALEARM